jgi:5'-methylthioadenosine phosphorylase
MTRSRPIGVITGTGITEQFELGRPRTVGTRFGVVNVFTHEKGDYVIIPRHGADHISPPHGINYRANIAALGRLGVRKVIATSAVGSMNQGFRVGEIGLADQFLDFTKRRQTTFFERTVVHTDMTYPYSRHLNKEILAAAKRIGLKVRENLVYVCAEGPRFETAAEIKMFRTLGGDVVGMTGVPEVVLANEMKLEYSSVLVATNWAAGMQPKVTQQEVLRMMKKSGRTVKHLIEATVAELWGENI